MGKRKITSLFVIAAAMLLALPSQAQLKVSREEVKAMASQKKALGQNADLRSEFENAYPIIAKQMKKVGSLKRIEGAVQATATAPAGPRKTVRVKNMGAQSLVSVAGCNILASEIYSYSVDGSDYGHVSMFNTSDPTTAEILATGDAYITFGSTNGGGLIDGVYYGAELQSFFGLFYFPELFMFNMEDGTSSYEDLEGFDLMGVYDTATSPTGDVYGIFYNADGSGLDFGIADYENRTHSVIAAWGMEDPVPFVFGITKENVGYMVADDHNFYKVDLATGAMELIGPIGYDFYDYYQTGEIDQKTNTFYWMAFNPDFTSSLVTIDLETGAVNKVADLGNAIYVNSVVMTPAAEDGAPAAITDLAANFENDALTGIVSFTIPATTFAGEELTGDVSYSLTSNGSVIAEGTAAAGQQIEVEATLEEGQCTLIAYTSNEVGESPKSNKVVLWVGQDFPAAPQNVAYTYEDGKATVTWDAVTTGAHNGYVGDVVYTVTRYCGTDENVVAEDIEGTEFVDETGLETLTALSYAVIASNKKGNSSPSVSEIQAVGPAMTTPCTIDFSFNDPVINLCKIIDANGDGTTWGYYESGDGYMRCSYNSNEAADDYLILPRMQLKAGKQYAFGMTISSGTWQERFEVLLGKEATAEALTQTIIEPYDVTDVTGWEVVDENGAPFSFTVEEDGEYYIAIHMISDPDQFWLGVHNVYVETAITAESPMSPRLAVQPDPYGADNAVITVTAPKRNVGGDLLTAIPRMDVYRDGKVIASYEDIMPEDIMVVKDKVPVSATYTYQARVFDEDGDGGVKSEKISKYIGLDAPASLDEINVYENAAGNAVYSWKPVTKGANGGVINPDEISYSVYEGVSDSYGWSLGNLVATTDNTTIEIQNDNSAPQTLMMYMVVPNNEVGVAAGYGSYTFAGAPYALPYEEHFAAAGWNHDTWLYGVSSSAVSLANSGDVSDGDGDGSAGAIALTSTEANSFGYITGGKVSMRNGNMTMLIDAKSTSKKNALKIVIDTPNNDSYVVAKVFPTDEYQTFKISLSDFTSEKFVKFTIYADFKEAGTITFDNIKISDLLEYNLATTIEAPKSLLAGQSAKINVKVINRGEKPVDKYAVKLFADEELIFTENVEEELVSFAEKNFAVDYATSIFDDAKNVTLSAEVEYELDLDDEDNVAETILSVKESSIPGPENVKAEKSGNDVVLTWDAPSSTVEEVTESFEDKNVFVPFSLGGIDAENRYGAFGAWTLYDGNNSTVYGFNGISFENAMAISAWQVWTPGLGEGLDAYAPATGEQCLISWCPANETSTPPADHWLISPELPGVGQTISFKARAITDQYGAETFEVYYSTTDNKVESFVKVEEASTSSTEYASFSFALPEGAKYFAIRHTSTDIFALLIDDITYTAGGGSVAKYNIYVDGEDGVYESTTATTYTIKNAGAAKWAAVSSVMANGKESKPVVAEINGSNQEITAIEQITGSKSAVDIYSIDGKLVRQQATSLEGLKGAYVINGQKVVVK
ncbi:MAG: choice-of-anchor J domain-containing protein [Prevotella sp.]|nr:choice-of-anchor J domain-containing protein [Prevotella sp.]